MLNRRPSLSAISALTARLRRMISLMAMGVLPMALATA
jgi:hypothetical protein